MNNKASQKNILLTKIGKEFLERDCGLMSYYNDIRNYNVLSQQEIKKLFNDYHYGTQKEKENARDKIFNHNTKLVVAVAKQYCRQEDNLLDLIEEGNIGLLTAIDRYDVNNVASFGKYALYWIRREINMFKYYVTSPVIKSNSNKTSIKLKDIVEQLSQKLCRKPTYEEIFDEYNKNNPDNVIYHKDEVFDVNFFRIDNKSDSDESEYSKSDREFDLRTAYENDVEENIETAYNKEIISELLPCLNNKERVVVNRLYGLENGIETSMTSIAEELNCSIEYVRQLNIKAIEKLKRASKQLSLSKL
jgi:RNA polymerase primary sigma factor